ncbi:O-methyltransferase [Campylobacterota bacterium]|nr:O-methyltransferase [Campylobacterota bacterium]
MIDAKSAAQKIAFAPLTFQAVRALLELRILSVIDEAENGLTLLEIEEKTGADHYTANTLTEVGLCADILTIENGRYMLTKIAQCFLYDPMTKINIDFVNDVCYQGAFYLKESFEQARPLGLKVFGDWTTVYEGLSQLPIKARQSWFAFDHFYSDHAFDDVIKIIVEKEPTHIFDIGCNTGRFELALFDSGYGGKVTLLDLPQQLKVAKENLKKYEKQSIFYPINILDRLSMLPANADAILMSQFLDCFALDEIILILQKAKSAMSDQTRLYILEPFWDKQRFEAAKFALTHTSLYFTAIANGNSKMYAFDDMQQCLHAAGLELTHIHENIGAHEYTLLECINANNSNNRRTK